MRRQERYRLLETVRQYALERLAESGDEAPTRDRHLGFYVALCGACRIANSTDRSRLTWRTRLDAERENILLAFAHARPRARRRRGGP